MEMIRDVSLAMLELHLLFAEEVEARVAWPRDQANLSRGGGVTSSTAATNDDEEEGSNDDCSAKSEDSVS